MARKKKKTKKQTMARYGQFEIADRRDKVHKLRVAGHTLKQIQDILKISKSTVFRDLEAIRAETEKHVDEDERRDHLVNALSRYDALEASAWDQYRAAEAGMPAAIKALDLLRVLNADRIKALKDTGYIKAETQQVEVQVNHRLEEVLTPQLRDDMSMLLLEQKLTPNLAAPVPEDEIIDVEPLEDEEEGEVYSVPDDVN